MKQLFLTCAFFLLAVAAMAQPSNRVRLRQLEAAPASGYIIQSLNDTCLWVGVSSVVKYQTLRDDGTPLTQRDAINFVATSTVATTLTDDAGGGETEVALSVPTGGIGPTELAGTAVTPGSYTYGGFTVDADGRLTAASSGTTPVTGSGAATNIAYWSGANTLTYDNNQLYWDATNNTLLIGTNAATIDAANSSIEINKTFARQYTIGSSSARLATWGKSGGAVLSWNIGGTTLPTSSFYAGNQTGTGSVPMLTFGMRSGAIGDPGDGDILKIRGDTKHIGIGLANGTSALPEYPLHVVSTNTAVENVFTFENNASVGIPAKSGFLLRTRDASAGNQVSYGAIYSVPNATGAATYDGALSFWTAINASFAERGRFNLDGAFLVGTTSTPTGAVGAFNGGSLQVKGAGATSATVGLLVENSAGTDALYVDNAGNVAVGTAIPAREFHVEGEARITDLTTDTPTRIVGADADGDLGEISLTSSGIDHGGLAGLADDDHTQYAKLAGRSGGQIVYGGTVNGNDLTLRGDSDLADGEIIMQDQGGNIVIGGTALSTEIRLKEPSGSGTNYTAIRAAATAANVLYTLPTDDGDAGEQLQTNGSGTLSWEPTGTAPDVQIYAFSGTDTYVIPTGVRTVEIICIGAGGGGGSGRRGATTEANTGGGGGGGGAYTAATFAVSELSSTTLNLTIGAGGNNGAARSTDNTNGADGSAGGDTYVECSGYTMIFAEGGDFGRGGSTAAAAGGSANDTGDFFGYAGASSPTSGTPTASTGTFTKAAGGGGAGGSIATGGTPAVNGGAVGKWNYGTLSTIAGGTAPGGNGNDCPAVNTQHWIGGNGGSGGASSITAAAGAGGDGLQGGGGGGGGASLNATGNSGAGGDGGDGFIMIIAKY